MNYQALARKIAKQNGIDPDIFVKQIGAESAWNPNARSGVGAAGLAQLMPRTAKELGVTNLYDPKQSLSGGARYLARQLKRFGGDYKLALAAYNAGPGAVQKYKGIPPYKETQNYVSKILGNNFTPTTNPGNINSNLSGGNEVPVFNPKSASQLFGRRTANVLKKIPQLHPQIKITPVDMNEVNYGLNKRIQEVSPVIEGNPNDLGSKFEQYFGLNRLNPNIYKGAKPGQTYIDPQTGQVLTDSAQIREGISNTYHPIRNAILQNATRGAVVGSIVPGLGTLVGALAGAGYGVRRGFKNLDRQTAEAVLGGRRALNEKSIVSNQILEQSNALDQYIQEYARGTGDKSLLPQLNLLKQSLQGGHLSPKQMDMLSRVIKQRTSPLLAGSQAAIGDRLKLLRSELEHAMARGDSENVAKLNKQIGLVQNQLGLVGGGAATKEALEAGEKSASQSLANILNANVALGGKEIDAASAQKVASIQGGAAVGAAVGAARETGEGYAKSARISAQSALDQKILAEEQNLTRPKKIIKQDTAYKTESFEKMKKIILLLDKNPNSIEAQKLAKELGFKNIDEAKSHISWNKFKNWATVSLPGNLQLRIFGSPAPPPGTNNSNFYRGILQQQGGR